MCLQQGLHPGFLPTGVGALHQERGLHLGQSAYRQIGQSKCTFLLFFTARKRSLAQGNVLLMFVCSQGGLALNGVRLPLEGVLPTGGRGSASIEGFCLQGFCLHRGIR